MVLSKARVFSVQPPAGDYVMRGTDVAWIVQRSLGDGKWHLLSGGNGSMVAAQAKILSYAMSDGTAAWEAVEDTLYRLIETFRPAADREEELIEVSAIGRSCSRAVN